MAIALEFNVILARKTEIEAKYPGGLSQFSLDWLIKPPERYCEDDHLIGFSSMASYYDKVLHSMQTHGIEVFVTSESEELEDMKRRCEWINNDYHPPMIRCWLKGTEAGKVARFHPRLFADN